MKSKGSRYEREFVGLVDDMGLPAERRYGSQQCDDVRVAHRWRIECKYRADGTGFKRLYDWLAGHDLLILNTPGATVKVQTLESWADARKLELECCEPVYFDVMHKDVSTPATLLKWLGGADYLACRMARAAWLVVEVL